jgi:hypothetical protein
MKAEYESVHLCFVLCRISHHEPSEHSKIPEYLHRMIAYWLGSQLGSNSNSRSWNSNRSCSSMPEIYTAT